MNRATGYCQRHQYTEMSSRCPKCVREEQQEAAHETRRFLKRTGFALLPVALVAGYFLLHPSPRHARLIDPQPHRRAIETLETALFSPGEWTPSASATLRTGLEGLSLGLKDADVPLGLEPARDAIVTWATASSAQASWATFDRNRARADWERLRDGTFLYASWFQRTLAAEPSATVVRPGAANDPALLYAQAMNALYVALNRAHGRLGRWPDDPQQANVKRLEEARGDLRHDIEWVMAHLPPRDAREGSPWLRAREAIERAALSVGDLLRDSPAASKIPIRGEIESRRRASEALLGEAQSAIDEARRTSPPPVAAATP